MPHVRARFDSFMAEEVQVKRRKLYVICFLGLAGGLFAIVTVSEVTLKKLAGVLVAALAVWVLNF